MSTLPRIALLALAAALAPACTQDFESEAESETALAASFLGNKNCPKSGDPVTGEFFFEHDGQRVYFCNPGCAAEGGREPLVWIERVYGPGEAVDNETCPVTQEPIPEDAKQGLWQGHRVNLCCSMCIKAFERNPGGWTRVALGFEEAP